MAKQKFNITNWATYNKALIHLGSLTIWLDESAIQAWYDEPNTSSCGRPQRYSELVISTVLMLKHVFNLTLCAAQEFMNRHWFNRHLRAGERSYTVTATVSGQSTMKTTAFVADAATAHVSNVKLVGDVNSLPVNGQNSFSYTVTALEDQGNAVPGVKVIPTADKAGVTVTANTLTDYWGQATITLTSSTLAVADVMVSALVGKAQSVDADKAVSFIANAALAKVSTVTLDGNIVSKVADDTYFLPAWQRLQSSFR